MGMNMPQIGQMKAEVGRLEGQKSAVEGQRESMRKALSELKSKKSEIDAGIADLRGKLGQELPPQVKKQITDRLSMMKNARKSIVNQIGTIGERLSQTSEAVKGINAGIKARKGALERLAGQMTRMPMYNREMGKKKA